MPENNKESVAKTDLTDRGRLSVKVTKNGYDPVRGVRIDIMHSGDEQVIESVSTNESGESEVIELAAPPLEYSQEPSDKKPYADYTLRIHADGYETVEIKGSEILPEVTSIQPVNLNAIGEKINGVSDEEDVEEIEIGAHTLYGEYPPKEPEEEIKPMAESGEIVLSRVVIPEYVVVHNGVPSDKSAKNYYVKYKDYIKNVVSSEIYATWPESTIIANTLCILSFTMNRVYTEWYRGKGYDFTITNSTAFDQKWIYGRNIYTNVNQIVDRIFANYLSKPGVRQPLFTAYCDGRKTNCSGLKQWGSKNLGDNGYSAIEILRYYYGSDIYINEASAISGIPASWPGYVLSNGMRSDKIKMLQKQLNRIGKNYPAIPKISEDGIYGPKTANAVKTFQKIFYLPQTGNTDYATWYEISNIYVGVSRISEPS